MYTNEMGTEFSLSNVLFSYYAIINGHRDTCFPHTFLNAAFPLDGEAFVVQAKRTGVEAVTTLGRATLTFKAGQEGEVMKSLSKFSRELMALQ
jgi:hypothetical protein